eukprot:g2018.t1
MKNDGNITTYECDYKRHRLYTMTPNILSPSSNQSAFKCYSTLFHVFQTKAFKSNHGNMDKKETPYNTNASQNKQSAVVSHSLNKVTKLNIEKSLQNKESRGHLENGAREKYSSVNSTTHNWDKFYRRHRTNFFKDRHYMEDEFPELESFSENNAVCSILEAGCGVGNTVLPLIKKHSSIHFFATDFSQKAIQLLVSKISQLTKQDSKRIEAFVGDISSSKIIPLFRKLNILGNMNIVMMIFSLSAIPPERHQQTLCNVANALCSDGVVLFRDYARCDHTQLKFTDKNRLGNNFYVRQDGTLTYFFQPGDLVKMFESNGFETVEIRLIERVLENRQTGNQMSRLWINARFRVRK